MTLKSKKPLSEGVTKVLAELPQYAREVAPRVLEHPNVLVVAPQLAALAKKYRLQPAEFIEMILSSFFNRLGLSHMVGGPSVEEEIKREVQRWRYRIKRAQQKAQGKP